VTPSLRRRLFLDNVQGGTLVYARHIWERLARYPDSSLAEDATFLRLARRRGARLERMPSHGHFVYLRHGRDAWGFACGTRNGWRAAPEPSLPPDERAVYAARSPGAARRRHAPLVSCMMRSCNRREWVLQSIDYSCD
jgi:hypothetical protein